MEATVRRRKKPDAGGELQVELEGLQVLDELLRRAAPGLISEVG
jgi:hypothetical protein